MLRLIAMLASIANGRGQLSIGRRSLYLAAGLTKGEGDARRAQLLSDHWLVQTSQGGRRSIAEPATASSYRLTVPAQVLAR